MPDWGRWRRHHGSTHRLRGSPARSIRVLSSPQSMQKPRAPSGALPCSSRQAIGWTSVAADAKFGHAESTIIIKLGIRKENEVHAMLTATQLSSLQDRCNQQHKTPASSQSSVINCGILQLLNIFACIFLIFFNLPSGDWMKHRKKNRRKNNFKIKITLTSIKWLDTNLRQDKHQSRLTSDESNLISSRLTADETVKRWTTSRLSWRVEYNLGRD